MQDPTYRPWSARRVEDHRFLTGNGRYVGDMTFAGMVHAEFVRSTAAHAIVTAVDVEEARRSPGTVAVFTAQDLDLSDIEGDNPLITTAGMTRPVLAKDRVLHVGEAVAVVLAETQRQAEDAAALVWPDLDELPPVLDAEQALVDDPVLHTEKGTNVVDRSSIGTPAEVWSHDIDVTTTVKNQRLGPVSIEPVGALAKPDGNGGLVLWVGHQAPQQLKDELIDQLGISAIEVIVPDVGGGFGMKARLYPEYVAVCAAALRLDRPVRWLQSRREHLLVGSHGRDMIHRVRLAGDSSGRFERAHVEILCPVGAYPQTGALVPRISAFVAQQLYDIPEFSVETTIVVTSLPPTAPYRGAGRPEAAYAMERAVDAFARTAGLDPVDVRRRNLIASADLPRRVATGAIYDSGDYRAALDKAVELVDVEAFRADQESRRLSGASPIGLGFGAFVERAGGPLDSGEFARVQVDDAGKLLVFTGSTSNGQGHETVWAQVAGTVFDLPLDQIQVFGGDTSTVKDGWGSMASRSAQVGASGVWRMATEVRELAADAAAELLEASPEDIVIEGGVFGVVGTPGVGVSLAEVARHFSESGRELAAEELFTPGAQTFPYGVHAAIVEVEVETGDVRLLRIVAVDDCGNVLNPMIVEGQVQGSLVQGIGQALYEEIIADDYGQIMTTTLVDYLIPHAEDIPPMTFGRLFTPAPSNPLGLKGTGEGGCIGGPPAIVNAVLDALAPYGVTEIDMPLRPAKVWHAIREAASGGAT